jgi:hypothetical protein
VPLGDSMTPARCRPRLLECRLDPVGDEGERRTALHRHGLAGVPRQHEHRMVEGRVLSPPAVCVWIVGPRALTAAVHPPTHDRRRRVADRFLDEVRVHVRLTVRETVSLAEGLGRERPLVQPTAALPKRLLERGVRSSDETVERHRDIEGQLSHRASAVVGDRRAGAHCGHPQARRRRARKLILPWPA